MIRWPIALHRRSQPPLATMAIEVPANSHPIRSDTSIAFEAPGPEQASKLNRLRSVMASMDVNIRCIDKSLKAPTSKTVGNLDDILLKESMRLDSPPP
jgi:hypothetical protein